MNEYELSFCECVLDINIQSIKTEKPASVVHIILTIEAGLLVSIYRM
ncbi:hypothetical protein M2135_000031 [Parabacteroides sp. PF5-9]|nr:hypothetical protein [Parabacteroides sp. PF5-9]